MMRYRSARAPRTTVVMTLPMLLLGIALMPATGRAQSLGETLKKSATGIAGQAQEDAEAQATGAAKEAAKGAATDVVESDSSLKAAAQEGVSTGAKAAAGGADLGTAGKKGAAAAVDKALGTEPEPKAGRVTKMLADPEADEEAEETE